MAVFTVGIISRNDAEDHDGLNGAHTRRPTAGPQARGTAPAAAARPGPSEPASRGSSDGLLSTPRQPA